MHKSLIKPRYPAWLKEWSSKDRDVTDDDELLAGPEQAGFLRERVQPSAFVDFVRDFCEAVDSPRALGVWLLFYYGEHDEIVDPPPVVDWPSALKYRDDYLVTEFLTKCVDLNTTHDRRCKALETLQLSEDLCRETNTMFRMRADGLFLFLPVVERAYQLARLKMASILGQVPDFSQWEPLCRFGPGADVSTLNGHTSAYKKFQFPGSATPSVFGLIDPLSGDYGAYDALQHCKAVPGNEVFFVFKNAKTFRTAAKEPRWNSWFQSGIGLYIGRRLLRYGQDLQDQSRNQRAAKRAYANGDATVDLKMASDTNACGFMIDFLPPDWLEMLWALRSPAMKVAGKWVPLHKMSSMGNGYTFPLETAVFYSLAVACCEIGGVDSTRVEVYGDDCIVPQSVLPLFLELLRAVGFIPNEDKTHGSGRFFESCGKDYLEGVEVRPIYAKRFPVNAHEQTTLANKVLAYALGPSGLVADGRYFRCWSGLVRHIPNGLRLFGPVGTSGVLHSTLDRCTLFPNLRESRNWQRGVWSVLAAVATPRHYSGSSFHAHLYSKLRADLDCQNAFQKRSDWVFTKKRVHVELSDFTWSNSL